MSDPYGNNPYGGQNPPPPPQPNPYGAGGGYGAPQGGYTGGPESLPPQTDGVSVASLVLSLLCCTGLIGLILGFVGLSRTKGGKRKGRGFAIAGIVIGALAVIGAVVGGVFLTVFVKSVVTPDNAEAGQCINITDDDDTLFLREKDCSEEHDGEVVYVGKWKDVTSAPSSVTTDEEAQKAVCSKLVGAKAASFPADLTWTVAFNDGDQDDPQPDDPFLCYVESDTKLDKSLL